MCVSLRLFLCVYLGVNLKWSLELVSSAFCSIWQHVTCVLGGGGWGGGGGGGADWRTALRCSGVSSFSTAAHKCVSACCLYLPPLCWLGTQGMLCTYPALRPALPAHPRRTLMGSDGGGGGTDSSVTLTRAPRPLSQSGIAHPQCQRGEFIFLAPGLPCAGCRGPPTAGVPLSLCPKSLLLLQMEKDLLGTRGMKEKNACDLHLTWSKHMAVVV